MSIYINTRTRATIDSPTPIHGGNWVLKEELKEQVKEEKTEVKKQEEKPKEEPKKEQEDRSGLTKKDIMQELDAFGIEYSSKATKAELLALLEGN